MGKPVKENGGKRKLQKSVAAAAENPFERRGIIHRKHEVFNRRVKGSNRNVAAARTAAHERRKKTLLVDWQQDKKANVFEDRRFGEDDPDLPLEEKMWMRLQRERSRRTRHGAAFNLADGGGSDEELLTHKGRALGAGGDSGFGGDRSDDSGAEDEALGAEVVNRLHFGSGGGGGEGRSGGGAGGNGAPGHPKSHRDVLEEIILKSKEAKREKAKRKEDQEGAREELDEGFGELLGLLEQRPTKGAEMGRGKGGGRGADGAAGGAPPLDDYDKMARSLVYEARVRASERTLTPEEAARRDKERLDELEKERRARMQDEADGFGAASGGGKRGRGTAFNDDELGDDAGAARKRERGSLPIVFAPEDREDEAAAAAAAAGSEEGSDDDDDSGSENGREDGSDDGNGGGGDGGSDASEERAKSEEREVEESDDSGGEDGASLDQGRGGDAKGRVAAKNNGRLAVEEIPYVLECPTTMEELLTVLARHAKSAADVNTVIDRVRRYHSVRLDGRNKEKMHNFYGLLLRRFQRVGQQAVQLPPGGPMDRTVQLDFLTRAMYDMTQETPDAAGALWHRTLGSLQQKLAKRLRDAGAGGAGRCWPDGGALLLLRLLPHLFPTSDFQHPVATPAALLLGQCLAQCPVRSAADVPAGLFAAGLALEYARPAGRFVPEAVSFLAAVVAAFAPAAATGLSATAAAAGSRAVAAGGDETGARGAGVVAVEAPATDALGRFTAAAIGGPPLNWLRAAAASYSGGGDEAAAPAAQAAVAVAAADANGSAAKRSTLPTIGEPPTMRLDLRWLDGGGDENDGAEDTSSTAAAAMRPAFAAATLATAYRLLTQQAALLAGCDAAHEAMAPAAEALARVHPAATPQLPPALRALHTGLADALAALRTAAAARSPLRWPAEAKGALRTLAPKFAERYTMGKDGDLDRDRAQVKQMQRQLKREKKGAARELKRDAAFLSTARDAAREERDGERRRALKLNRAWLEQQQASFNKEISGKAGRMNMKGGGTAAKKAPKVGRGF